MDFPLKFSKLDFAPSFTQVFTPTNTAILASVGLHAFFLGLALPFLQAGDAEQAKKNQVGVIELSQAEQSRLPETSPFAGSSSFLPSSNPVAPPPATSLPNSSPDLKLTSPSPSLPSTDYNYNTLPGQLPQTSTLPPLPPLPSYPSYPNLPSYPSGYAYPSSLPSLNSYNTLNRLPIANPPLPSLPAYRPRTPNLPGMSNPDSMPQGKRPNFGELPPPKGTDFITRSSTNPGTVTPEPELQPQGQDTPSVEALRKDLEWRAKLGTDFQGSDFEAISLVGSYPRIACRNRTEASVVYNVDPRGGITPISQSRYPIFNQLALQSFQSQQFTRPTRVTVNFRYDPAVCGTAATAPVAPNLPGVVNPPMPGITAPALPPATMPNETVTPLNNTNQRVPQLPVLNRPEVTPGTETPNAATSVAPASPPQLPGVINPGVNRRPPETPTPNQQPGTPLETAPSQAPPTPESRVKPANPALVPPVSPAPAQTVPPASEAKPTPTTATEPPKNNDVLRPTPSVTPNPPVMGPMLPETRRTQLRNSLNRPTLKTAPAPGEVNKPANPPASEVQPQEKPRPETSPAVPETNSLAPATGKK